MKPMTLVFLAALTAIPATSKTIAQNTEFTVKLLSPLDTNTNRKGDKFSAQVSAPAEFAGDIIEGSVQEVKGGAKIRGNAVLNFAFETLQHGGNQVKIRASVKSLVNSKGKENVDEEGRVIKKKNSLKRAALGAGLGALIGGIAGGASGAAIGAAAGGAAVLILSEIAVQGARIFFAPGTEFVLDVRER
jgi:hypothetical protein